jgi:hypothetical protein
MVTEAVSWTAMRFSVRLGPQKRSSSHYYFLVLPLFLLGQLTVSDQAFCAGRLQGSQIACNHWQC